MPIRLVPPRQGRSKNYRLRGTYLRVYVDESTGTPVEALAKDLLRAKKRAIERGLSAAPVEPEKDGGPTFLAAAVSYIEAGGDARFLGAFDEDAGTWSPGLITYFGERPLSEIDQAAIDTVAIALYPAGSAPTRNRQVYTPVSAILKHSGFNFALRRPKGWRGNERTDWRQPEQVFRLLAAAREIDLEFAIFLAFLVYTGARLSDPLALPCDRLLLDESFAYFGHTKNGDPRGVHLPPFLVAELANHPRGLDRGRERVFRFRKCGRLYTLLAKVRTAAGPDLETTTFHTLCHTWATWMRRYAGLDTRGLVGTGRWRDEKSARRYEHVVASEESRKADLLPAPQRSTKAKTVRKPWSRPRTAAK